MARVQRRVSHVKGLQDELDKRIHNEDDIVATFAGIDTVGATDEKTVMSAKMTKTEIDKKIDITSIVNDLTSGGVAVPLSAEQGKILKTSIDGLSSGLDYKGPFDATGTLPADPSKGDFYKVSVAGTVDGLELAVGDMIISNAVVVGASAAANWDKIDNTEAADILRTANISTDADWTVDPTLLSSRATTAAYIKTKVDAVSVKFVNETVTITGDTGTLTNQPVDNVIFMGTASVLNADGTYDIVECSVDALKVLTLSPTVTGDYDGLTATVTFAYTPVV